MRGMNFLRRDSLTGRLLWSLCLLQVVTVLALMVGGLYHLVDEQNMFVHESVTLSIVDAVEFESGAPVLQQTDALRQLRERYPQFWAIVLDEQGGTARIGQIPDVYQPLISHLAQLGRGEVSPRVSRPGLALCIDRKEAKGRPVQIVAGGAASSDYNLLILQATQILSPYFLVPLVLLTLVATPLVVLSTTRRVRKLAMEAAVLNISDLDAHLNEASVPKEVRPLVTAFNSAMSRLRKAYLARDRFLRDAAHELRMPIAILMARLDSLRVEPLRSELLTDLGRLSNVAEQLLDLHRLKSQPLEFEPVDLVALARSVVGDVAPLAVAKGDELILDTPAQPVWVQGQAGALGRVIMNLIQNAMTHAGGGTISVIVGRGATITVQDQGPGIPEAERELVLDPFYRGASDKPGHGLGLHLVQKIVQVHKGRMSISSRTGGGAVFTIYLPLQEEISPQRRIRDGLDAADAGQLVSAAEVEAHFADKRAATQRRLKAAE